MLIIEPCRTFRPTGHSRNVCYMESENLQKKQSSLPGFRRFHITILSFSLTVIFLQSGFITVQEYFPD